MTRSIFLLVSTVLLATGCSPEAPAPRAAGSVGTPAPAEGETRVVERNVVQTEMQLLTTVLENAVRAVGMGDVSQVAGALHRLEEAKHATEAALKDGRYALPRNNDQLPAFLGMDGAFHGQLEAMVEASRANDVPAMARAIGGTLTACDSCHALFRDP
jgi:cytochrome c556